MGINGVVLRIKDKSLGDVGEITAFGKTLIDWVGGAFGAPFKTIEHSQVIDCCEKLRAAVDRTRPVTVVLYCDTPLVTSKTVAAAVKQLRESGQNMLKLPRGFVFKTEHLFEVGSLYLEAPVVSDHEFATVSDGEALSRISDAMRRRILRFHSSNGVRITDFYNTYIDCDVVLGAGVTIEPYNFIKGKTVIKSGATIMPGNYIENCIINSGARIDSSRLYNSVVGERTKVGPFAYIRPDTVIGSDCRIGDYVELKNCVIGAGCKVSHLSYVGDAELGDECNVGCGVVFANYDGKNKYRSIVGKRVFIGSNANIVAPVVIADRSFIAAGSTITKAVPEQALAIARARQSVIPDWQGNMYAPPSAAKTEPRGAFNLVQYDNGIIDASSSGNADKRGDGDI